MSTPIAPAVLKEVSARLIDMSISEILKYPVIADLMFKHNPLVFNPFGKESTKRPGPYTHLRAHETVLELVFRLLLEKKKVSCNLFLTFSFLL